MPTRTAHAEWNGSLPEGKGTMEVGSGAFEGPYSFASRMEEGPGTNPEELIGAAHAGCYSMALSGILGAGGHEPESISTDAKVTFAKDEFQLTSAQQVGSRNLQGPIVPGNPRCQNLTRGSAEPLHSDLRERSPVDRQVDSFPYARVPERIAR